MHVSEQYYLDKWKNIFKNFFFVFFVIFPFFPFSFFKPFSKIFLLSGQKGSEFQAQFYIYIFFFFFFESRGLRILI